MLPGSTILMFYKTEGNISVIFGTNSIVEFSELSKPAPSFVSQYCTVACKTLYIFTIYFTILLVYSTVYKIDQSLICHIQTLGSGMQRHGYGQIVASIARVKKKLLRLPLSLL